MVTTRPKCTVEYKDISDDEMNVDGFAREDEISHLRMKKRAATGDVESDSEYDVKPKMKKTKTGKTTKRKGKVTARSLMKGLFTTLPLDLIYEIFGHLHPLDLLNLARTSKMLRAHLMSKRSLSLWRVAREGVFPPVPDCPKDQSEPQWARLLFTHECTTCGTPRIQKVDWRLRLRGCESCFKTNIIYSRTAKRQYPHIENLDIVMELLPWTNTGGWAHGHSSSRKFYFSEDLIKMAEVVEDFQLRIDAGIKGARAEFDEFVEKKKAEAEEQVDSGEEFNQWATDAAGASRVMDDELREKRSQAMIDKMIELGHDPRDVERASYSWRPRVTTVFNSPIQLNDSVWRRVKSRAEKLVEVEKQRRLDVERRPIRDARRNLARSRYAAFKETYDASPDRLLPQPFDFLDLPMIKTVIQDDGDDVSPDMFDDAFDELPAFFDEWRRVRRVELARMLLDAQAAPGDVKQDPVAAEKDGILYLATSFFSTCNRWGGSGYDEDSIHWMRSLHRHFARTGRYHALINRKAPYADMRCIQVVPEFIEGAKLLVQAVGLDPKTATTLDMDEIDPRFWCKDCSILRNGNPNVARSWRNCIMHLGFHAASSPWNDWELLSPDDRATIEANEDAASALQMVDWNKTAISLQRTAANLQGWNCSLKIEPLPTPA